MGIRVRDSASSWLDLFDPNYMDHVCDLLRENHPGPVDAMRPVLLRDIDAYIDAHLDDVGRTNVEAAERFRDTVDDVTAWLEGGAPGSEHAARLRLSWLEFIADGAGHYVYHGTPQKRDAGRKGGQAPKPRRRKLPSPKDMQDELAKLEKSGRSTLKARAFIHRKYKNDACRQAINKALRRH